MDLRPVFFIIGLMITGLGVFMFVPMFVDLAMEKRSWGAFAISGIFTTLIGSVIAMASYSRNMRMDSRGAFILTGLSWVLLSLFSAVPFLMDPAKMSFTDALFEATSGITTTGATIMTGLDDQPQGILFWRAILQWIGGIGIIATAMAILPMLQVGGMQLFKDESSNISDQIFVRPTRIAFLIGSTYLGLTLLCGIGYVLTGMGGFDASAHAMTTLATGGYSTSDLSMGGFMDQGADIVSMVFMLAGAMPFGIYMLFFTGNFGAAFRDPQVPTFLGVMGILILMVAVSLWLTSDLEQLRALRFSAFNTISIVTGTGYASADYNSWGSFAVAAFFVFMFIGGCAGSTACSIKIFRYQVAFEAMRAYLRRMPRPNMMVPLRYGGKPLAETVVYSVMSYFFLFFMTFALTAIILSVLGLDTMTAWSGAGSAVANVGPGLGDIIGPTGTYEPLPDSAKWVLLIAMIVGRLEIITALVMLSPSFWRG